MALSQPELRVRAEQFAREWAEARHERADAQTFWNEFFQIFGVSRRRVATFEEPVRMLGDRAGGLGLSDLNDSGVPHFSRFSRKPDLSGVEWVGIYLLSD